MLKILCILMQKNFCSLFTFPVFRIGSVYTLFVENVGHLLKERRCRPFRKPMQLGYLLSFWIGKRISPLRMVT